jgi:hypothetical protein
MNINLMFFNEGYSEIFWDLDLDLQIKKKMLQTICSSSFNQILRNSTSHNMNGKVKFKAKYQGGQNM